MVKILHTPGNQFRIVGTLREANGFINPGFEAYTGSTPDNWVPIASSGSVLATAADEFRFGTRSCKVTNPSHTSATYTGLTQAFDYRTVQGATYQVCASLLFPTPLPSALGLYIQTYDDNMEFVEDSFTPLTDGQDSGWVDVTGSFSIPDDINNMSIGFAVHSNQSSVFYIDGVRWMLSDVPLEYVDGDTAGYVWETVPLNSRTLSSVAPDALHFFKNDENTVSPIPVVS